MTTDAAALPRTNAEHWLDLERERRSIEARLKSIVSTQDWLRTQVLERWANEGISSEKVDGYTVYLRRSLYPKTVDKAEVAAALKEADLSDLLTVDDRALGIWLSAHEDAGTALPERLAGLIGEPFERFSLAVKLR